MSCEQTVDGAQSEFEFFRQMIQRPDPLLCCGPKTGIAFTVRSMPSFLAALRRAGRSDGYLDNYELRVTTSGHTSLTMCAKHWIYHARALAKLGQDYNNSQWKHISFYMFKYACSTNNWDYKEIVNYAKTIDSLKYR